MKTLLRRIYMPMLKAMAFDLMLTHHWVPSKKFALNSFKHKGYWFHGKRREQRSMELFGNLIKPGMTLVEVGGHIGYMSLYFASLAGEKGRVVVFEPGGNNLPYIKKTIAQSQNIQLIEKGVGREDGTMTFFEESLTGQNNSFVNDFDGLAANREASFVDVSVSSRPVEIVSLDSFCTDFTPEFIKIDVEGFEYDVLLGARRILESSKPLLMVEVQKNQSKIFELLRSYGYRLFDVYGSENLNDIGVVANVFCLHREAHNSDIKNVFRG